MMRLCSIDDVHSGGMKEIRIQNRRIVIGRKGDAYFAMHGLCPHQGASFACGSLSGTLFPAKEVSAYKYGKEGEIVRCPWHNWEFDMASGCSVHDPKMRVKTYEVKVQGNDLYIDL